MSSLSRIQKELADFNLTPHPYFSLSVINEYDLYNLHALILGPESTPYEGGTFHIDIELPPNYPFRPPKLNFLTKIFHPNISEIEVCHNLFRYDWIPTVTIFKSLETVIDLMRNPKTYVSINTDIAAICVADRKKYD
jgi:ubiquitin-protein ligase